MWGKSKYALVPANIRKDCEKAGWNRLEYYRKAGDDNNVFVVIFKKEPKDEPKSAETKDSTGA